MKNKYILFSIGLLLTAGCASSRTEIAAQPAAARPDKPAELSVAAQGAAVLEPTGAVTLELAIGLALENSPLLEASAWEARAAEAQAQQAGAWHNPELELEMEGYDKQGAGTEFAEVGVSFGTKIELGGKRRLRKKVASGKAAVADRDHESGRLDVIAETTRGFMAVVAAQEHLKLAEATMVLMDKVNQAVAERVKAGKEPPFQAAKASAELELADIDRLAAHNELNAARLRLASMWGSDKAVFTEAESGVETRLAQLPELKTLKPLLQQNPALTCCDADVLLAEAVLSAERAGRIPTIKAKAGMHQELEDDSQSFSFGIEFPLPVFDRNKGNITAAKHEIRKAEAERRATELELASELASAHANLAAAAKRVSALQSKVVPAMESAFESAHEGYRQGKFSFLDMLDAQRGLYEARGELVDALFELRSEATDIERIIGISLSDIPGEEE